MGLVLSIAFLLTGILFVIDGDMARWEIYACLGVSALWYMGWYLSTIWTKLKEIQEGLYASFYMQNKEEIDREKEVEE